MNIPMLGLIVMCAGFARAQWSHDGGFEEYHGDGGGGGEEGEKKIIPVDYNADLVHLGQHIDLPEIPVRIIKITKTVAIKVPVPYPVKVKENVPYPVHVVKPFPVHVPHFIPQPHQVNHQPAHQYSESAPAQLSGWNPSNGIGLTQAHFGASNAHDGGGDALANSYGSAQGGILDVGNHQGGGISNHNAEQVQSYVAPSGNGNYQVQEEEDNSQDGQGAGYGGGFNGGDGGSFNGGSAPLGHQNFNDESNLYDNAIQNYYQQHGGGAGGGNSQGGDESHENSY